MTQWNEPPGADQGGYGHPPEFGQPGYGQPSPYYDQPSAFERSQSYGIVGTVLTLLGGIAVLVSFTALDWFKGGTTFSDLHDQASADQLNGFPAVYFGWLGWVFLIIVVIAGVLASVPTPALRICRIIGIVVGIAASGLSFLAIQLTDNNSYSTYIQNARVGFWFAVAGFLIAAIGAGVGPRRG